jgi:hypothetical protein
MKARRKKMPKYDVELLRYVYHVSEPFTVEADSENEAVMRALKMGESKDREIKWDPDFYESQIDHYDIQCIGLVEEPADTAKEEGTRIERAIGDGGQS